MAWLVLQAAPQLCGGMFAVLNALHESTARETWVVVPENRGVAAAHRKQVQTIELCFGGIPHSGSSVTLNFVL